MLESYVGASINYNSIIRLEECHKNVTAEKGGKLNLAWPVVADYRGKKAESGSGNASLHADLKMFTCECN